MLKTDTKRICIFLALAFGIPWSTALILSQTVLMRDNPLQAAAMANGIFIATPWLANLLTRLITRESWKDLWLKPNFRIGWKYWLALWLLPLLAVIIGGLLFYAIFPQSFDPAAGALRKMTANLSAAATLSPGLLAMQITLSILFISSPINAIASLGEEFGWRAYLLQKLCNRLDQHTSAESVKEDESLEVGTFHTAGAYKGALLTGAIHGIWHLPLIVMTSSYSAGLTLLTVLVYLVFTMSLSVLFSWGVLKSGSVWPAAIGHGVVNALSVLPGFFLAGQPLPLLGPDPSGLLGGSGFIILALSLLFYRPAKTELTVQK